MKRVDRPVYSASRNSSSSQQSPSSASSNSGSPSDQGSGTPNQTVENNSAEKVAGINPESPSLNESVTISEQTESSDSASNKEDQAITSNSSEPDLSSSETEQTMQTQTTDESVPAPLPSDPNNSPENKLSTALPDTLQKNETPERFHADRLKSLPVGTDAELPDYDPETQLVFKGEVYEKDEDIEYKEKIRFIPNYSVFVNDSIAYERLEELADLLKEYPDKKVRIISHAGWDEGAEMDEGEKDYQIHPYTFERIKIHYGRGRKVYGQTLYNLGLENEEHLAKIERLGLPDVTEAEIGKLLRARALEVKETLVKKFGVRKQQIVTAMGSFDRVNEHIVEFKIK